METATYDRRGFSVEAVQVTEENIADVAVWCGGHILEKPARIGPGMASYIKVPTVRPLNEKQTEAYVTDWVLKSPSGFKVYMDKAFTDSFQLREQSRNVFDQNEVVDIMEPEPTPEPTTREKLGLSDPRERFRSAETGEYVTEETAKANPAMTVRETD